MNMGDNSKGRVLFFFFWVLWCVPSFGLGRVPFACDPKNGLTRSLKFCRTNVPNHVKVQDLIGRLTLPEKIRLSIQGYDWWSEALHGVSNVGSGTKFGGAFPGSTSFPHVITTASSSAQSLWREIGQARFLHATKSAKDGFGKSKSRVKEEAVSFKAKSDEKRDLLIEGGGVLLHATALGYLGGLRSACGFILKCAVSDDYCTIAKDRLEKSQNWVEEKVRATGISDEQRDLLIRSGGALVLAPAIGYWGGFGSAFGFLLSCAPPDNYYYQMAQNRIEMSKSWVAEKLRAQGITDEQMDSLIKAGGALALAASIGYDGFKGRSGSTNAFDDSGKLMKAPGRPGELIVRAAFEANPRAYFGKLRGKHP